MNLIRYSVVATSFNDSKEIIRYLDNICAQAYPPDEIVIADGGSKDDTVSIINEYSQNNSIISIRVIQDGRLNIAEGYNKAIKASKNNIIGITGIGNLYDSDYFSTLINYIEDFDVIYSPIRGFDSGVFSKKYNNTVLHGNQGSVLEIASNHGAIVKKNVFEELNYFYENFVYAGEDAEFYDLVRKKGYKSICVNDAYVYWYTPNSFTEYFKQKRVYAIGEMQIKNNMYLIIHRMFKPIIPFLLILICALVNIKIGLIALAFYCCYLIVKFLYLTRNTKASFIIWIIERYNMTFQCIRYAKYLSKKYKVRR